MIRLSPVRQSVSDGAIDNIGAAVWNGLHALPLSDVVRPGMRVAVAVGSRGISRYAEVVGAVVDTLKAVGAEPFLVPAMGSHGGGTAQGQRSVLESSGMDAQGVPIRSSLEVKRIGEVDGMPVYWDRFASEADAVIPVNRVKAHTAFRADHESGLCKIMTIGLGNKRGAATLHAHDAATSIPAAAKLILEKMPVVAGVAVVENGRHAPAEIAVLSGDRIFAEEPRLLRKAKALQPTIPFPHLDLLIIQEMGKNISGTGMDTNVVGMWRRNGGPRQPDFRVVAVLALTVESHGNASGVGLADLIPERLRAAIDWHATYTNCRTAGNFAAAKQPMCLPTDREVVAAALGGKASERARVAWIRNTLALETMWLSPALLEEAAGAPSLSIAGPPETLQFDDDGSLVPPVAAQAPS